ncbi:MAG: 16S rRNA (guanine(527)-N(7))-methyltransferase RsmG [Microbacteriaceae bacterium]|nr:16S rRNA (guanine(527)-N(7))-methyltransferase RsmG [Microbacteriaceae bacterium]
MFHVEQLPKVAEQIFGDNLPVAEKFANLLVENNEDLGLLGPLELERIWSRHILNSALLSPLLTAGAVVADIGSGGGFPGIPLAIIRSDVHFTLVEPMTRRAQWLEKIKGELDLKNLTVLAVSAGEVQKHSFDQVTARAVSALSKLIPMTAPLLISGGQLVLMKGKSVEAEMSAAAKARAKAKLNKEEILTLGTEYDLDPTYVYTATVR